MKPTVSQILIASAIALPVAAQDRQVAEAKFDEGTVKIEYAAPTWKPEFAEVMAKEATWRLGKNDPTRITTTCGLATAKGCIPAGEYGVAMKKNDKGAWDLVVYSGNGHYSADRGGWSIAPIASEKSEEVAEQLALEFDDDHQLHVRFGPNAATYALTPIAVYEPVETEFAQIPAKLTVMAVPLNGEQIENVVVGTATAARDGIELTWNLALTVKGDKATLTFDNPRASGIAGEKKQVDEMIERVSGMLADASGERKDRLTAFLDQQKAAKEKLAVEEAALGRFQAKREFAGEIAKAEAAAKTLSFESERVTGAIVLKFGVGQKLATFKVVPREFVIRNSGGGR